MENDEIFEAQVGPLRDALRELVEASSNMRERAGLLPNADSRAMRDIALEEGYRGAWGDEPVECAVTLGDQLVHAGEDHCKSICTLFDRERDPVPVYSHLVLARSALEAFGRAWLLSDPDISLRLRIARGRNERLNSLHWTGTMGDEEHKTRVRESRHNILADADRFGFERAHPDQVWLLEERAGPSSVIATIVDFPDDDQEPIGPLVMNFYSLTVHSTVAGLGFALGHPPAAEDITKATQVETRSHDVMSVLIVLILGHIRCVEQRRAFMGWTDPEWFDAVATAQAASSSATKNFAAQFEATAAED